MTATPDVATETAATDPVATETAATDPVATELEATETDPVEPRPRLLARILVAPIRFYRTWISPALPPSCRFRPSCSAYAVTALSRHGAVRGSWLTLVRILKCAPWHPGGHDPVPPARVKNRQQDPGTCRCTGESEQQC